MSAKNLSYVFALLLLISSNKTFAAKPIEERIKNLSREVVDTVLYKEIGLISNQLPYSVKYDYNRTIDNVSYYLKRLLEKTASIVFKTNLDTVIANEVEKRLQYYYLTTNDIHISLSYEFQQKLATIRSKLDYKMIYYYKAEYVTLKDIQDEVRTEIDYDFCQKIKNQKGNGESWGLALGKFGVDLAIGICNALSNKKDEAKPTEKEKVENKPATSKPEKTYYSENCVVCQDDFQSGERVGVLSCGHTFHPECIKSWLAQSKTCPLCRAQHAYLAKIYDTKEDVPGYKKPAQQTQVKPSGQSFAQEDSECSICLDNIQPINLKTLKCGHKYHTACIEQWFKSSKSCPLCRSTDV